MIEGSGLGCNVKAGAMKKITVVDWRREVLPIRTW